MPTSSRESVEATIVVPTRGRPEELLRCIDALLAQRTQRTYEILLVDDSGDGDEPPRVPEAAALRVLRSGGRGPAAARNSGVADARGDAVLFTDDDTIPDAGWVDAALTALESDGEIVGVEGATISDPFDHLWSHSVENHGPGGFLTANIAFRTEVLRSIGGFDEQFPFPHCEDLDLAFRAARLGPIAYSDTMKVHHPPRPVSTRQVVRRGRLIASELRLFAKHPDRFPAPRHVPAPIWHPYRWVRRWLHIARAERSSLARSPRRAVRFAACAVGQVAVAFYTCLKADPDDRRSA